MKNAIKSDDLFVLVKCSFTKYYSQKLLERFEKMGIGAVDISVMKDFPEYKYTNLLDDCTKNVGLPVFVDIKNIEEFLVDAFYVYECFKYEKSDPVNNFLVVITRDEISNFIIVYEKCLFENDFETLNMIGIQKNIMFTLLQEYISDQKFEECVVLRDKFKINQNE